MRRLLTALLVLVLAAATLAVSTGSAEATSRAKDGRDARRSIDTQLVRLFHNYRGNLVVQMYSNTYDAGARFNGIDIALDTRGDTTADYKLVWDFARDGDGYQKFALYKANGSTLVSQVRCRGLHGEGRKKIRAIEVHVPLSCIKHTKTVGVRTRTWDFTRYRNGRPVRGYYDAAPNRGWLR